MIGFRYKLLPTLCWVLFSVAHSIEVEVSVVPDQSQVSAGSSDIKSCLSSARRPAFKVRFQKLKGKRAIFTRTLLDEGIVPTVASEWESVGMTNIVNCLNVAAAKGFIGFSFTDGTCNMFNITPQTSGCETVGQDVFYVQDSFWAPKGEPGIFSLNLIHGLSSILAVWEPCVCGRPSTAAKFQLTWNHKIIVLNKTTFNYTLNNDVTLCKDNLSQVAAISKDVTLEVFDDAGTLMKTVKVTLNSTTVLPGKRYLLNSSNCLYYDDQVEATFNALEEYCRTQLQSTMFIEYVDGDFSTYRSDLISMFKSVPSIDVYFHYVGLRSEGVNWTWLSGLPQPVVDREVWINPPAPGEKCAQVTPDNDNHKITSLKCTDMDASWVCHDYIR